MNAPIKHQIIEQGGTPLFVVIPYDEYLDLIGRDDDDVTIPLEVSNIASLENKSLIRAWREHLGMTQEQVAANALVMCKVLVERGLAIVSGRTESHVFLVDLRAKNLTGKEAEALLGEAHITVNKNAIPNDPQKPFVTSGIRIGTPAVTTRGFGVEECVALTGWIADILDDPENETVIEHVKTEVLHLCRRFPVYAD